MTVRICIFIPIIAPAIIVMLFQLFVARALWLNCTKIWGKRHSFFIWSLERFIAKVSKKGITQRYWNSSLIKILGGYVTCPSPFLQYFMVNKCRMLPWIHIKGINFHSFNFWKSNLWNILITYICTCTTQTVRLMY